MKTRARKNRQAAEEQEPETAAARMGQLALEIEAPGPWRQQAEERQQERQTGIGLNHLTTAGQEPGIQ